MSDPATSPASADIAALTASVKRLRLLTYISLGFNAFFLLLIIIGMVAHHHRHHHHHDGFGRDGGQWGHCPFMKGGPGGMGFHRWGGDFGQGQGGWRDRDGWGGGPGGFGDKGPGGPGDFDRGPGPGMMGGGMHKMMGPGAALPDPAVLTYFALAQLTDKLKLTEDQQAKLKPIVQAQITALEKQMDDGKSQVRAVLTPDQQKQFDAFPFVGTKPAADSTTTTNAPNAGK